MVVLLVEFCADDADHHDLTSRVGSSTRCRAAIDAQDLLERIFSQFCVGK
jgi:tRNA U34 5-carboxymethylaminomethyl modifying GTPase MnmE/TrmE